LILCSASVKNEVNIIFVKLGKTSPLTNSSNIVCAAFGVLLLVNLSSLSAGNWLEGIDFGKDKSKETIIEECK